MIDLHMHTYFSDGASSPEKLLKDVAESGVRAIAITDHNNVDIYDYLDKIDIKKYYHGKIIRGVELNCGYEGKVVELLGYGIDVQKIKPFLNKYFDEKVQLNNLQQQFNYLNSLCEKMGIKVKNVRATKSSLFSKPYFLDNIKSFPENKKFFSEEVWQDYKKFYRVCVCNPDTPFYIDMSKYNPSIKQVADVIHKLGGKAVIAHSWLYGFKDTMSEVENIINSYNVDGAECYYPNFTQEQSKKLVEYCKKNKLIMTGGSDYHGEFRVNKIGTGINNNLYVPDELLEQFYDKDFYLV